MERDVYFPKNAGPKHSTQIIRLLVGALLFILGLSGILFEGFAGLHLSTIYSSIIAFSGALLFYHGYQNSSRDAFMSCFGFSIFYGLHAIAGWVFGSPGVPRVGHEGMDPKWITIIPNIHELGRNDHILNTVLAIVLMGGAIDWWRRHSEKGNRGQAIRDIKNDYRERYSTHSSDKAIRH
jgi:hypothetical protein